MNEVKKVGRGFRQDANIANLGYWPTDQDTMYHVTRMLEVDEGVETAIFDCSCGKLDALKVVYEKLQQDGAKVSAYGIELHAERYNEAKTILREQAIPGEVLHADALHDVSLSEGWAGLSIFNPPYGELSRPGADDEEIKVRLERLFWTQHISRTKKGTGITVAILPTQLFVRDVSMTKMIARHFTDAKIYRAADASYNQVVIIGYRVDNTTNRNHFDHMLAETLLAIGEGRADVPNIAQAQDLFEVLPSKAPQTFTCFTLTDEMAQNILQDGSQNVEACRQQIINHSLRAFGIGENIPSVMPLRDGHVPAVLASGRLNGRIETELGVFLFRGKAKKTITASTRYEADDKGRNERQVFERIHRTQTAVTYIDITPGREIALTQVI
ncbi:DUF6094 domain-containing protein [Acidithiobacillus marinus]|uniref:DUF6094 domain-containing protein n=1 Tax=Acidithiobacillus marinus TaxID=187490 RepID=UPI001C0EE9A3|nr:DUF6094 domain-containing protein [Acidithiobacillus marinus]